MSREQFQSLPASLFVRELRYQITRRGYRTREVTLVTTLLDHELYPATELASLYQQRWQIETDFAHLKVTLGMDVLKCRTVTGVEKEAVMFVLVYNLVRMVMMQAVMNTTVPQWALRHVAAALNCGLQASEIEAALVAKGLTSEQAADAIDQHFAAQHAVQAHAQQRSAWLTGVQRALSLAIVGCLTVMALRMAGIQGLLQAIASLMLPLACIWFPDAIGSYVGSSFNFGVGRIDRPTPGVFVSIGGWLLMVGVPLMVIVMNW